MKDISLKVWCIYWSQFSSKLFLNLVYIDFYCSCFFQKEKWKIQSYFMWLEFFFFFFFFFQWFIFIILKKSCSFNVFQWHFVLLNSDSKGGKAIQNCLKSNRINTKTSCLVIFLTWNCVFSLFFIQSLFIKFIKRNLLMNVLYLQDICLWALRFVFSVTSVWLCML